MPRSSRLILVVPQFLADASRAETSSIPSLLGRIAGRGRCVRQWISERADAARLQSWQRGLLSVLDLTEHAHPSAPLAAVGLDLDTAAQQWLQVDLVHLAAGLNEVTLVPLRGANAVTLDEAAALASVLRPHLAESGLTLHDVANEWLIDSLDAWDVATVTAEFARTHDWSEALPQGTDAGKLRRLMTELQMLLHEHPVNQRRAARGMPTANAVWCWGNGRVTPKVETQIAECAGRNAYLRGICRVHGWRHSNDVTAAMLMSQCEQSPLVVGVVETRSPDELESQWLAPLVDGLKRRRFASLRLILDEWDVAIDRWQLRAFWRSDRPIGAWDRA